MNIIHAVRSDAFAGVEAYICGLAKAQTAAGHHVWVIGGDPAAMTAQLASCGAMHSTARTTLDVARRLMSLWGVHPDIVHAHMTAAEIPAALVPSGRTLVVTRHFAARRGSSAAARHVAALCARRVAAQISVSQYVADHIDGKSVVVHSGVEDRPFVPPTSRNRTVLIAQRLEPEKWTAVGVQVFARSALASEGWRLRIAGSGSQRDALQAVTRDLRIEDQVEFLGHRNDVQRLMDDASMMIATSPSEPFGLSVVEAMSCGLPVVAAGAGGHLETVGSVADAALFTPGDIDEAARLLRELANNPGRRAAYGDSLRDAQRARFTLEHQARQTDEVYRSVL